MILSPSKHEMKYGSVLSVTFLILLAQCSPRPKDLSQGEQLFKIHCASCHGAKGEGSRGPALAVPRLFRAPTEKLLIGVIRTGIRGTEMPGSKLYEDDIGQIAAWVRRLGERPAERVPGDAKRGEQLYFTKGNCAQCHAIKGRGGPLGPDLTEIGLRRSAAYLRAALIEPETDVPYSLSPFRSDVRIAENFLQVRLVTKDGRDLIGVRLNEDAFSIQIRDLSDRIHSFFKSELMELHKDPGKSPMPSYRGVFSEKELDDVVAFLASLRGER
jgi:cytochrome c oxidase cbb3-type subunit 3